MLDSNGAFKYKTSQKGTFDTTHCWTTGMAALPCGAIEIKGKK